MSEKNIGIPNCLSLASKVDKICFQYTGVPLTELINENALPLATSLSTVSAKIFLFVPALSVSCSILCISTITAKNK